MEHAKAVVGDDFESWSVGSYIAVNNPAKFVTWNNQPGTPEDTQVVNDKSSTLNGAVGTNSIYFTRTVGNPAPDLIYKWVDSGTRSGGKFYIRMDLFVDTGMSASLVLLSAVLATGSDPAGQSVAEVYFYGDGSVGVFVTGNDGVVATFSYTMNQWFTFQISMDLDDTPRYTALINGNAVASWNGGIAARSVAGVEFYPDFIQPPGSSTLYQASYHVDNIGTEWTDGQCTPVSTSPTRTPSKSRTVTRTPSRSRSPGSVGLSNTPAPTPNEVVVLTLRQASRDEGIDTAIAAIARATEVDPANITVFGTGILDFSTLPSESPSPSFGADPADPGVRRHARASCFDTNPVVRLLSIIFKDLTASARLAALVNTANSVVRTSDLCIANTKSESTLGSAPTQSFVPAYNIQKTEASKIDVGLGVGLGVGLVLLLGLLVVSFAFMRHGQVLSLSSAAASAPAQPLLDEEYANSASSSYYSSASQAGAAESSA